MPSTSSKANLSGACSISQTMKVGEKSWRTLFASCLSLAKISYFLSSASLSSLTRFFEPRKTSSNFSSARRPDLRWQ